MVWFLSSRREVTPCLSKIVTRVSVLVCFRARTSECRTHVRVPRAESVLHTAWIVAFKADSVELAKAGTLPWTVTFPGACSVAFAVLIELVLGASAVEMAEALTEPADEAAPTAVVEELL